MRKPIYLTPKAHQQGFVLFIVLITMMIISLLVAASIQSHHTEQRISANDADSKFALSLAESALNEGENVVFDLRGNPAAFTDNCLDGLCRTAPPSIPVWKRMCGKKSCIEKNGRQYALKSTAKKKARYVIELIKTDTATGKSIYRITAKAWGQNGNTVAILQSYVSDQ